MMRIRYNKDKMIGLGRSGRTIRRAALLGTAIAVFAGIAMASLLPYLQEQAIAADSGSAINLPQRGQKIDPEKDESISYGTCTPYWDKTIKSRGFLQEQFYPKMDDLPYKSFDDPDKEWEWLINEYDSRTIHSRVGNDFGEDNILGIGNNQSDIDRAARMLQRMGKQEIPIIRFRAAPSGSTPMDGVYSSNGGICGSYVMIPIDYPQANNMARVWRGFEFWHDDRPAYNPEESMGMYMEFTPRNGLTDQGDFTYWGKTNGGEKVQKFSDKTLYIAGTYPTGTSNGSLPNVGTINASWVDAATIKINNSPQNFAGEVYRKHAWNTRTVNGTAYSYYFLDKASPGRESLAWDNANKKCEDALPLSSACGGGGICVPFIAVKQQLNVSPNDSGLGRLQKDINQLGGAQAELYDFTTSCLADARYTIALSNPTNAKIWMYYSAEQKALIPVFTSGDGNEAKYIGVYNESRAPLQPVSGPRPPDSSTTDGEYKYGECAARVTGNPLGAINDIFAVKWTLTDGTCGNLKTYGTIDVTVKGGAAGEEAFGNNQEETQDAGEVGDGEANFICNIAGSNPFSWVFCPLTRLAIDAVDALESIINSTLTLKTDRIFNDNFYKAWAGFRTLALALIAIAALIMVISQAAGIEILDAYTIKKVLPRLLFAAIAITISWAVMQFLVNLSNDVGAGIRFIIYSPFPNTTNLGGVAFTGFLVALLSSGALLVLGLFGMLSFIGTALLAAAVAFGVIVFRELLVMFLVMSAPFAIACYILPNTQKLWEMWKNAFIAALLVFAIITTFIALGRVFAIVAIESGGNETLNQIIAIVAYIMPYFLITTAFRMAGGVMAAVGGFMNDRTKGGFDRLRNFRANQREDRAKRWREGRLYDSNNMLMRPGRRGPLGAFAGFANRMGERRNLGVRNGFGFTERGRQAGALHSMMEAEENRKNPWMEALANSDDSGMLVLAASGGNARRARQFVDQRIASGQWGRDQGREAYNAAMAVGINRGTSIAALQKLAENKSRQVAPGDIMTIRQAIADVSEGNTVLGDKLSYDFQYRARTAGGRVDLGGVWHDDGARSQAQTLAASMAAGGATVGFNGRALNTQQDIMDDALGTVAYFDGASRTSVQQALAGHPNEIKALSHAVKTAFKYGTTKQKEKAALLAYEVHKGLAAGQVSDAGRDDVNQFLSEIGVDAGAIQLANQRRQASGQPPISAEDILAQKVGFDPLPAYDTSGQQILVNGQPVYNNYTAAMLTARARAFDTQAQRSGMMGGTP